MAPTTPSSNKSSGKKSKSSASKKQKDQITPIQGRRLSKTAKRPKLTSDTPPGPLTSAAPSQNSLFTADDEEMAVDESSHSADDSPQAVPKSGLAPLTRMFIPANLSKRTLSNSPESKSTTTASDNDEDDDEDNELDVVVKKVEPEVIDSSGTEITGGFLTVDGPSSMQISAYPRAGELKLVTVNPLNDPPRSGLAPTANLPFELQLWWNLYAECHTSESDASLWAMVTLMNDTRKLSDFEVIKLTLSNAVNYVGPIIGPGMSKFFLIR
ncbi:hypothetical protein DFH28DRAFT_863740, partial [Melampsora americana]